ncbi:hypothetical protein COCC4DRAFT_73296 [Bipolaris maydis ATCC 48331]|uniref:Uncharacterized protein n=2 Tax=Cochliobolus heterostrophus TaxID=5016 RepID=M2V9W1_COCH5|nr:uncharacterized protein COCC4DRAFT_73296 [Bipolaris maydis ATCC 48331]EMD96747.1 hypothetical protein COCHEDRAFT_1199619 [Bipolaris maydis C5]ENI03614.1 hypothetical protein COCC4DRAFT_73296 [Bipolaris maydis ATCC 48331]KAJ6211389.1 hypothetical protein PSV09DRAFT_1199619 [Bipolaris maydis]
MQSDQDLNGDSSGGTSRASNVPAASRTSGRTPGRVSNSGFSAPVCHAVSSMLHTETETGSVGNVPIDGLSDIDNTHRQTQRHRESSKMLTTLPSSNTSGIHSGQSHRYSSSSSIPRYPTASNRSQYGTNAILSTMLMHSVSSPQGTLRDRHQDQQRSQSMAHGMQPHSGFSSDPPLTSPPRVYIPQSQNSYTHVVGSYRPESRPVSSRSANLGVGFDAPSFDLNSP